MKTTIANYNSVNVLGSVGKTSNRENLAALLNRWRRKIGYFSVLTALPTLMASQVPAIETDETSTPLAPADTGRAAKRLMNQNRMRSRPEFLRRQSGYLLPHQKTGEFDIVSAFTGGSDNCPGATIPPGTYTSAAPFTDTGDTTGANNTVNNLVGYYYNYNVTGPDLVYTFTLTSRGTSPEIRVTPTSSTYNPAIYILDSRWNEGCPNSAASTAYNWSTWRNSFGEGSAEVLSADVMQYLPLNVPLHLFIDSNGTGDSNRGSYTLRMQDVSIASGPRQKFDFNADNKADLSVFRPSDKVWYSTAQGFPTTQFGLSSDIITPADFDGDGKTDVSIFRDGSWWRINSSNNTVSVDQFGLPGDIPVPADYTGDGRADLAIYRGGTWWTLNLANGQVSNHQFGLPDDKLVPADYDGDGKTDQAIFRNGVWHLNRSAQGYMAIYYGLAGDVPVPAKYGWDGRAVPAVFRNGVWYFRYWEGATETFQFGLASDIPVPADYDGDGYTDVAVYRNGVWYVRRGPRNTDVHHFGLAGDEPIPAAYLP